MTAANWPHKFSSANKKMLKFIFNVLNSIPSNERTQVFNELKKTEKQKISETNVNSGGGRAQWLGSPKTMQNNKK